MFCVVKVLDGFWMYWVYINGFVVIVLVWCNGNGYVYVLVVEFFFIGGGFCYFGNIGICNDVFYLSFVGVVDFFGDECCCCFCYVYGLFFE